MTEAIAVWFYFKGEVDPFNKGDSFDVQGCFITCEGSHGRFIVVQKGTWPLALAIIFCKTSNILLVGWLVGWLVYSLRYASL